jgi:hypothetical protein
MRTQKPTLRITKWVRRIQAAGPRMPLEAECSACADVQFKIKHDKRLEFTGFLQQQSHDCNAGILQRQFEEHVKLVHADPPGDA